MLKSSTAFVFSIWLLSALLLACGDETAGATSQNSVPDRSTPVPTATPTFEELKSLSIEIPYNDLFRNNELHVGKQVWYRAKVVQVIEGKNDEFQLRANVTEGEYSWDDTVFLHYSGPRLLEGDTIEFAGIVEELVSYEAVLGHKITIPAIRIIDSKVVAEPGEPVPTLAPTKISTVTPIAQSPAAAPTARPTPMPPMPPMAQSPAAAPTAPPTPMPTPTPLPPGFTIDNPVEAGGLLKGADGTEIVATAIVEDAWELIHAQNQFIDPPAEGNRFYMVTIDMAFNYGEGSLIVDESDFRLIGKNRVLYHPHENSCGAFEWTSHSFAGINPLTRELFIEGKTRGNICFQISEDESNLLLVHQPESATGSLRFLTLDPLENGSPSDLTTIPVEPHPDSLSLPQGFTLDDPVDAGGIMEGTDGTGIVATAIVEDAWELIRAEAHFNDPPAEGKRFYMVTVEVAYNIGEGFLTVDETDFALTGDHRAVYVPLWDSCGVTPDELNGELFIGVKIKGNLCFEIPENDSDMILIHQPGASGHVNTRSEGWRESRRFLSLE